MTNSSTDPPRPNETSDLGPLTLTHVGDRWRFTLTTPNEISLELPPDYEEYLHAKLDPLLQAPGTPEIEMSLEGLPALSSRQLGLMLALQKTLARHSSRLHVTGVSKGVHHLLNVTRTAQFFDLD